MLSDLLLSSQGFGTRSLRDCVIEVYQELTGQPPSTQVLREMDIP